VKWKDYVLLVGLTLLVLSLITRVSYHAGEGHGYRDALEDINCIDTAFVVFANDDAAREIALKRC
jgi:hypothetical protein